MSPSPRRVTIWGLVVCLIPGLIYAAVALLYHTQSPATPSAPRKPAVESPRNSPQDAAPGIPAPRPDPAMANSRGERHVA